MHQANVYFVSGVPTNLRSHKALAYFIKAMSLSPIIHVMVGDDYQTCHLSKDGTWYFDSRKMLRMPNLCAVFRVPVVRPLNFKPYPAGKCARSGWPSFWRHCRLGIGRMPVDCICTALNLLHDAGLDVPMRTTTPGGLYRWMLTRGYPHAADPRLRDPAGFRDAARQFIPDPRDE